MASYFAFGGTNLQKGARGDTVKRIQTALNEKGYNLTVDGIWGDKTDAAVRDFQGKSGLGVDGIYGTKTHTALFGKSPSEKVKEEVGDFEYSPFTTSENTNTAKEAWETHMGNTPTMEGNYTKEDGTTGNTYWDAAMQAKYDYENRDPFSFDLNGDVLYQQYKDQYMTQGKLAMQDTMGQAAAMTGGYGNSYATTAGNQAYQGHLQKLNDVIPELWQMAYNKYSQEGQDMLNKYSMEKGIYDTKYGEYNDSLTQHNAMAEYLHGVYSDSYDKDFDKWSADTSLAYDQHRDAVGDAQWEATFNEGVRQFNEQQAAKVVGGGDDTDVVDNNSDNDTGNPYNNGGYSDDVVKKAQEFVGVSADGKWGQNSAAAAKAKGYDSIAEVVVAMGGKGYDKGDYEGWTQGDWNSYFANIRHTHGKAEAEKELNSMTAAGVIPTNCVAAAAIGARGSLGH